MAYEREMSTQPTLEEYGTLYVSSEIRRIFRPDAVIGRELSRDL